MRIFKKEIEWIQNFKYTAIFGYFSDPLSSSCNYKGKIFCFFEHCIQSFDFIVLILEFSLKVQNGNYYLRNYDNAFLKNHLQNFTKVQWKSSLEETLCTTCQQLSRVTNLSPIPSYLPQFFCNIYRENTNFWILKIQREKWKSS